MRTHVLLLFGGESSEHDVSIAGAANVFAALDDEKYLTQLCYIDRSGKWWLVPEVSPHHMNCPQILPVPGTGKLVTIPEGTVLRPDVILPILHGKHGEDGTIQGLASLLHVPIVGPSTQGASVTMDKDMTKRLLRDAGVPVIDWMNWRVHDKPPDYSAVVQRLGATVFVKPSRAGSSVGVSKVTNKDEYQAALELAAKHDDLVLIEKAVKGREIEVGVLGTDKAEASVAGEIKPGADFYDYEDKYNPASRAEVIIPAEISDQQQSELKELALKAYAATAGRGMARIDFFLGDHGRIYLNEINAIPGFTNISMYPKLWRHQGLSYPVLLDRLIQLAVDK